MSFVKILEGDILNEILKIKSGSVDLIFADPPYNLSGDSFLTCKNGKPVQCNKGDWDKVENIDDFNLAWLSKCKEVLSDNGTIWVSGTLHNHPSIGMTLKKLGFWILNDLIWFKPNATPLLSKNRFAPSTELIWIASKSKKYYFNYEYAKQLNNGKQMKNLWEIPAEKHRTIHPTEKPESLIERIVLIGSKENDIILDPFMGSGTTGVIAKRFNRSFFGIEIDHNYFEIAKERISKSIQQPELIYQKSIKALISQPQIFDKKAKYSVKK